MNTTTIIGGKGFIGGHLVDYYVEQNLMVNVIDNSSTGRYINDTAHYHHYDLTQIDPGELSQIIKTSDVILHLAATARVQPSFDIPQLYFYNNVLSLVNVLDTLQKINYKGKFIYFSTSSVYGSCNKYTGNTENSILQPTSPYALSKKQCEEICEWYRQYYHLDIIIVRPFNVYGDRMSELSGYQTVLQKFLTQYKYNEPLTIYGDGNNLRDYTHIDDLVAAIDLIINKGSEYIYNIASNVPININSIVDVFPWKYPTKQLPPANEPIITRGNINLLKRLGYYPKGNVIEWLTTEISKVKK